MMMKEVILDLVTIYLAICYSVLYALFEAFPVIFIERRHLSVTDGSLMFIGVGIGSTLGALAFAISMRRYLELNKKWKGFPPPEERLGVAKITAPGLVVGILWLGWTGEYASIPWYVPALSGVVLGFCISPIFGSFTAYLRIPPPPPLSLMLRSRMYSASAVSASTIVRSLMAASFPLFTTQMFENLGSNWACTILGGIALLLCGCPFLFAKYGARIRASSTYSPCIVSFVWLFDALYTDRHAQQDLRIAKELEEENKSQSSGEP
jgi:hypothetical protein